MCSQLHFWGNGECIFTSLCSEGTWRESQSGLRIKISLLAQHVFIILVNKKRSGLPVVLSCLNLFWWLWCFINVGESNTVQLCHCLPPICQTDSAFCHNDPTDSWQWHFHIFCISGNQGRWWERLFQVQLSHFYLPIVWLYCWEMSGSD